MEDPYHEIVGPHTYGPNIWRACAEEEISGPFKCFAYVLAHHCPDHALNTQIGVSQKENLGFQAANTLELA